MSTIPKEPEHVMKMKGSSMLEKKTILKSDHFPGSRWSEIPSMSHVEAEFVEEEEEEEAGLPEWEPGGEGAENGEDQRKNKAEYCNGIPQVKEEENSASEEQKVDGDLNLDEMDVSGINFVKEFGFLVKSHVP